MNVLSNILHISYVEKEYSPNGKAQNYTFHIQLTSCSRTVSPPMTHCVHVYVLNFSYRI